MAATDPALLAPVGAALVGWVFGGFVLGALAAVGAVGGVLVWRRGEPRRRAVREEAELPGILERVARALRSGQSLAGALESVAAAEAAAEAGAEAGAEDGAGELEIVCRLHRAGMSLEDAIVRWGSRSVGGGRPLATASLVVAVRAGGEGARAIDGVAATLRERIELQRELRAQSAQARASAAVLVAAPLGFLVIGTGLDPALGEFLFDTPAGAACLAGAAVLDGVAALWMRAIVRSVDP